jgi:predicted thioesterase
MKPTLVAGLTVTRAIPVDRERTIAFMGEGARVYATPMLVRDIEVVAREMLLPHLDDGQDTVGTRVEIDHLAATPLGMEVEITVSVASIAGRAITLEVSARDSIDLICRGRHQRYVVDVHATEARVAAKARKAGFLPTAARA